MRRAAADAAGATYAAAAAVAVGALAFLVSIAAFGQPSAPPKVQSSRPPAQTPAARPRVIVVGWDAGDWSLLDALAAAGKLPSVKKLVAQGRTWNLDSFQPLASPMIWTTLATGRTPVDHGVADFQELDPKTRSRVPITSRSRRVPAIWNLASAKGVSVGIVGWWATWPAERVKGFLVSDRAAPVLFDRQTLSRSSALTWPEGLADGVRLVGRREGTPGYADVARLLNVTRADFDASVAAGKGLGDPISGTQTILGATRVYARTALDLYDREKPELLMVYFEGTDEIGHLLGRFHPPRQQSVSEEDFRRFGGGVTAYYEEADRILGELLSRAERDGATLMLVSDHGFQWGADRPASSGTQANTAFQWHHSPGILAVAGRSVVPSPKRGRASVFDVVPTLCRLLELPPDPAFEGHALAGWSPAPPVRAVDWARAAPVERLAVPETAASDKKAADEFTKKLISLGYLTGAEASAVDSRPPDRAGTETAASFQNLATFLRERGKLEEALGYYKRALEVNPASGTAWFNTSVTLDLLARHDESDDALIKAAKAGYSNPEAALGSRAGAYVAAAKKDPKARARLVSFLAKAVAAFPENDGYRLSLGKVLFEDQECEKAEAVFASLIARRPADVESLNLHALASWCLGKLAEAKALFLRSLAVNPNQEIVKKGLAQIAELERGGKPSP